MRNIIRVLLPVLLSVTCYGQIIQPIEGCNLVQYSFVEFNDKIDTIGLPEANKKIITYLKSKIGKKVGDGICLTLIDSALIQTGLFVGKNTNWNDFVVDKFHFEKKKFKDVVPGDIIYIEELKLKDEEWWLTVVDGSVTHIAICAYVDSEYIYMLEQNILTDDGYIQQVIVSKYKKSTIKKKKIYCDSVCR